MKRSLPLTLTLLVLAISLPSMSPSALAQDSSDGVQTSSDGTSSPAAKPRSRPSTVFRLIVNSDAASDEIGKARLSQILLRKSSRWPDGSRAYPVDLNGSSDVREALSKTIHGRSMSSIQSFWQRQIFSGRSVPPPEMDDDAVLAYVRSQPGAVGYVAFKTRLEGVKELFVVED